jgi:hypothetical protein
MDFYLAPLHPNPFNPAVTTRWTQHSASHISLIVYDLSGSEVARLIEESYPAGDWSTTWDAEDLSSGIYLVRLLAPGFNNVRQVVLLK